VCSSTRAGARQGSCRRDYIDELRQLVELPPRRRLPSARDPRVAHGRGGTAASAPTIIVRNLKIRKGVHPNRCASPEEHRAGRVELHRSSDDQEQRRSTTRPPTAAAMSKMRWRFRRRSSFRDRIAHQGTLFEPHTAATVRA